MGVVRRAQVALFVPVDVRRHVVPGGELLRAERERHRRQALFVHAAAVHVDGVELAGDLTGEAQLVVGERDAGVGRELVGVGAGRRHRPQQLPPFGDACRRILGEERVQDRGAGAGRAGDEPGLGDRLVDDAGIVAHVRRQLEAHLEEAQQEPSRHPPSDDGELGFVLERGEQHVERFEEVVAAEVADAPVGEPERRARLRQERIARQRQLGDLGDRQDQAVVDGPYPLGTGRWLPGHGVTRARRDRPSPRAGCGT